MTPNDSRPSRRGFLAAAGAATLGSVAVNGLGTPSASAAERITYVDTSRSRYDKLVLMADGKPFHHSGIQFRYEKHKYTYGWTDAQLEPVFKMISEDAFTVVNMSIWWSQVETRKDVFDWTDLDRYLELCRTHGLKLELLWFGSDSGGSSVGQGPRLPDYVTTDYAYVLTEDGERATNAGKALLDKADPHLLRREKYVLEKVMRRIAARDTDHTLVGVQILNEPTAAHIWGGLQLDRSYSDYSNDLWTSGGYTDAERFRKDVLLHYLGQLAQVVKESDRPVWTRCNLYADVKPVAENEALRRQGLPHVDFLGADPYTTNMDEIYGYGTDDLWSQGKNFPMIMETFAGASSSDVLKFNGIAGNAVFNMYAAVDPDSSTGSSDYGFYDFDPDTKAVTRKDVSHRVAALNRMLNKISHDLATRSPVEAGGSSLQTFNRKAAKDFSATKPLGDATVTYTSAGGGQGIAVKRGGKEFALLSTREGTFLLPGTLAPHGSVEAGHYDRDDRWVRTGSTAYEVTDHAITIDVGAGECVRVKHLLTASPAPE